MSRENDNDHPSSPSIANLKRSFRHNSPCVQTSDTSPTPPIAKSMAITTKMTSKALSSPGPYITRTNNRWLQWLMKYTNFILTIGMLLYIICFRFVAINFQRNENIKIGTKSNHGQSFLARNVSQRRDSDLEQYGPTACMMESQINIDRSIRRTMIPPPENDPTPVKWNVHSVQSLEPYLTYPIFMPSMPKSGTTSVWKFFRCGNQASSHNWIKKTQNSKSTLSGICIRQNIEAGKPPFENCGDYDVYTDTGYLTYGHDVGLDCYFPSIQGLQAIYHSYPNATFINVIRNTEEWYSSLQQWSHSSLFVRFRMCDTPGFPTARSNKQDFYKFYEWHNNLIRQFTKDRPSINYIEVQLESPDTGLVLEKRTGISKECWKHCRPDSMLCEQDKAVDGNSTTGSEIELEDSEILESEAIPKQQQMQRNRNGRRKAKKGTKTTLDR